MLLIPFIVSVITVALFVLVKGVSLSAVWLGLGLLLGMFLLKADEWWLRSYYDTPAEPTPEQPTPSVSALPLITRSVLFMLAYIPVALFVVTSSGSWLGSGLVIGIGLVLLGELFVLRNDETALRAHFVPHLKTPLSRRDITLALAVFCVLLLFLLIKLLI